MSTGNGGHWKIISGSLGLKAVQSLLQLIHCQNNILLHECALLSELHTLNPNILVCNLNNSQNAYFVIHLHHRRKTTSHKISKKQLFFTERLTQDMELSRMSLVTEFSLTSVICHFHKLIQFFLKLSGFLSGLSSDGLTACLYAASISLWLPHSYLILHQLCPLTYINLLL